MISSRPPKRKRPDQHQATIVFPQVMDNVLAVTEGEAKADAPIETLASISEFTLSRKHSGVTTGSLGIKDGVRYLLKKAYKSAAAIEESAKKTTPQEQKDFTESRLNNLSEFVVEYIASGFYSKLLLKRAPSITLVLDDMSAKYLYLGSQIIPNFSTIAQVKKSKESVLPRIKGFAEVMAVMLGCGEGDGHGNNLGVITVKNQLSGRCGYYAAKVDHGRSRSSYSDVNELRAVLAISLVKYGYQHISFDLDEYKRTLEKIAAFSNDEVKEIVQYAVGRLQDNGINFTKVSYVNGPIYKHWGKYYWELAPTAIGQTCFTSDDKQVVIDHFVNSFVARQELIKQFIPLISGLKAVYTKGDQWSDGGWLPWATANRTVISEYRGEPRCQALIEPVEWAIKNNHKIFYHDTRGKVIAVQDPLEWALYNHPITMNVSKEGENYCDLILRAIENNDRIREYNKEGNFIKCHDLLLAAAEIQYAFCHHSGLKDVVLWAIEQARSFKRYEATIVVEEYDPLVWAVDNKYLLREYTAAGVVENLIDPIIYAIDNDKLIEKTDPIKWAALYGKLLSCYMNGAIMQADPIIWAMEKGYVVREYNEIGILIASKDPIILAKEIRYEPKDLAETVLDDPLALAVRKGYVLREYDGSTVKYSDPVAYALRHGHTIENKSPIVWAETNSHNIISYDQEGHRLLGIRPSDYLKLYPMAEGSELNIDSTAFNLETNDTWSEETQCQVMGLIEEV